MSAGWNLSHSFTYLPSDFFTLQNPTPVEKPEIVILNRALAEQLGLNPEELRAEVFSGNILPEGAKHLAQAYAGHQFGGFTMLGDGRAVLLGEQLTPSKELLDIQLKGSGLTPYSRGGDGLAAIGPMLREYIISEAMHALNIPTTRSLAVVTTGEWIQRERVLPGAVLTRVASSHLRVGTFEYASQWQTVDELRALADYAIERHYKHLVNEEQKYLLFLREVIARQADLIAKWQSIGFIHGVMNTDNMTISGETIDYGPCAFMDTYDPNTVFSSIDTHGRYAYGNQPSIGAWNLSRFAETLLPLIHEDQDEAIKLAQEEITNYTPLFESRWLTNMRPKIGLFTEEEQDLSLLDELLEVMEQKSLDFTNTFRNLRTEVATLAPDWYEKWQQRLKIQPQSLEEAYQLMDAHNPVVIPRNHRVEAALVAAEEGNLDVLHKLLDVLVKPYTYELGEDDYTSLPPESGRCYRTFCGT